MKHCFKISSILILFCFTALVSCGQPDIVRTDNSNVTVTVNEPVENNTIINPEQKTIITRFNPPTGYERKSYPNNSFASYLQNLPLKPFGAKVLYYNGNEKNADYVYISVIDMKIGKQDLQQCADAIMRLRGEYFYGLKQYDSIHFCFLSDHKPRYYKEYAKGDYSYTKFLKYMDFIFSYANTGSLYRELKPVKNIDDIEIGDVLIKTGNPIGHAIIVVDVAVHKTTGKKVFMLAQSYMPAQETQILINPDNDTISPWYEVPAQDERIATPEWTFYPNDLRRF